VSATERTAGEGERIGVVRALMLGDLLCATPALRALRHGRPHARITLSALPWARELASRLRSVDAFLPFPGWPGQPETPHADARALRAWLGACRRERFTQVLQMHGSGERINAIVRATGARAVHGFGLHGCAWPQHGSEVERLLQLTDRLGLPRRGTHLDFPLLDGDRDRAEALCAPLRGRAFALVHAGSQWSSRRWPAERFAAVADALADEGLAIVLTGTAGERALARAVAAQMRAPALDLVGRTTLWELGALVEWARQVVCNDTGISHIAAALGTPSIVVASGSDVPRWAPADRQRHRVFWHDMPCRPCAHAVCPHDNACAAAVPAAAVAREATASWSATRRDGARAA
jgi:ADP-heptose:LPS heptosyltransferase